MTVQLTALRFPNYPFKPNSERIVQRYIEQGQVFTLIEVEYRVPVEESAKFARLAQVGGWRMSFSRIKATHIAGNRIGSIIVVGGGTQSVISRKIKSIQGRGWWDYTFKYYSQEPVTQDDYKQLVRAGYIVEQHQTDRGHLQMIMRRISEDFARAAQTFRQSKEEGWDSVLHVRKSPNSRIYAVTLVSNNPRRVLTISQILNSETLRKLTSLARRYGITRIVRV